MISVGQIAGIISAACFLVEFTIPLAIVVVLIGYIGNDNTAATWSVVNRVTQISLWPSILQADTVQMRGVRLSTKLLTWTSTINLLLLTIAGIVTPLGLTETVKSGTASPVQFQYFKDAGPFGQSTPPRPRFEHSRICGLVVPVNCPGAYAGYRSFQNGSDFVSVPEFPEAIFNTTIPNNLTEIFSSRTSGEGNTLSGLFDIQHRLYEGKRDVNFDRGKTYISGSFSGVQRMLLRNATEAVEGLVVDTRIGGIGFRNHTLPAGLALGGTWSEDLTWVEPVTECVDTNLTIQFDSGQSASNTSLAKYLVDGGGFANLAPSFPFPGFPLWNDTQNPSELRLRAYKAAWISNALSAIFLNLTTVSQGGIQAVDSKVGDRHMIGLSNFGSLIDFRTVSTSGINGGFLDIGLSSAAANTSTLNLTESARARLSISSTNFTDAGMLCAGTTYGMKVNASHIAVDCGYIYGAAHIEDGRETLLFAPFTRYKRNLYVCASAMQASIKTVDFSINGTASLANLRITAVHDKKYASEKSKPLWAVENLNSPLRDTSPLWGLVDDRFEGTKGFDFIRTDKFILPATSPLLDISGSVDSLAGKDVFSGALASTYGSVSPGLLDYSGQQDFGMYTAWKRLTRSPVTAKEMINLIITDLLAAATVGTKSTISKVPARADSLAVEDSPRGTPSGILVAKYRKAIVYNFYYAIPAFIVLLMWAVIIAAALFMWVFSHFNMQTMRQVLNQTSTGRLVTNLRHPEVCDPAAKTTEWQRSSGLVRIQFDNIAPRSNTMPLHDMPPSEKSGGGVTTYGLGSSA